MPLEDQVPPAPKVSVVPLAVVGSREKEASLEPLEVLDFLDRRVNTVLLDCRDLPVVQDSQEQKETLDFLVSQDSQDPKVRLVPVASVVLLVTLVSQVP